MSSWKGSLEGDGDDESVGGRSEGPCCSLPGIEVDSGSVSQLPLNPKEKRMEWASKIPYVLTLVGYTIGFGDVWRFPYIVHSNGGVAFLVPYFVMLFIEGMPVFLMEVALGQRTRLGAIGAFNFVSPYFGGIGVACGMLCYLVGFYWNTLTAWVVAYLFDSFRSELPWKNCTTAAGLDPVGLQECALSGQASKYYWYSQMLHISGGIEERGEWNWYMFMCLMIVWTMISVLLVWGIKVIQWVVYVTATLPVFVFVGVFVANHFLAGSEYAYSILWNPDWSVLYEPKVWLVAATQTFFSFGLAFGSIIGFASYMPPKNDCYKDTLLVMFINSLISILATAAIFLVSANQGFLRYSDCLAAPVPPACDLEFFVRNSGEGTGLLFIAFAEAANQMPWSPPFWSIIFFMALVMIGVNSTYGTIEGVVMVIMDWKIVPWPRWAVTSLISGSLMSMSVIYAAGWGYYILDYLDTFAANWVLMVIALLEVIAVGWVYGLARFAYDFHLMTGQKLGKFQLICLRFVSPLTILIVLVASVYQSASGDGFKYNRFNPAIGDVAKDNYPGYVVVIGFLLMLISVIFIPLQALFVYWKKSLMNVDTSSDFPEEDLREERGLTSVSDVLLHFDAVDTFIIGSSNIDKLRSYLEQEREKR